MNDDPISFWLSEGLAWIKPAGDACHLNCSQVKAFASEMMERGNCNFAVDLGTCSGMDENFMGTLAGIALRLREARKGTLRVIGAPPDLEKELRYLGLDALFSM